MSDPLDAAWRDRAETAERQRDALVDVLVKARKALTRASTVMASQYWTPEHPHRKPIVAAIEAIVKDPNIAGIIAASHASRPSDDRRETP